MLMLYNEIIECFRTNRSYYKVDFLDVVLKHSKYMKEVPMIRDKTVRRQELYTNQFSLHYEFNIDGGYRTHLPSKCHAFELYAKRKQNPVKDCVLDVVTEIWREHQVFLKHTKNKETQNEASGSGHGNDRDE